MTTSAALPGFEVEEVRSAPRCLFSVDVEEWFHSNFRSLPRLDTRELPRRAEAGVNRILDALDASGSRATFFVLGVLAEEHPALVRLVADRGHEVGCHSYEHTLLYEQSRDDVARDVAKARRILQDASGQPVFGFRAPSWSITGKNLWAFDVLAEAGFRYDSSLFPAANYLYGLARGPRTTCRLKTPSGATLLEVPPSTIGVGARRIGVGGGLYLRAFPLLVHEAALRLAVRRGSPFVAYIHPRELDPDSWDLELPLSFKERLIHGAGMKRGAARAQALLRAHRWERFDGLLARA